MHADFEQMVLRDRRRELEQALAAASLRRRAAEAAARPEPAEAVVLRLCCVADDDDLDRLAALEGRAVPTGRHVVAEVAGTVVAALPLCGGEVLADPFRRTQHLIPLLELRARQIGSEAPSRRAFGFLGAVLRLSPARR